MNLTIFEKVWIEEERPSLSEQPPYLNRSTGTQGGQWERERTNARPFHFKSYADKIQ